MGGRLRITCAAGAPTASDTGDPEPNPGTGPPLRLSAEPPARSQAPVVVARAARPQAEPAVVPPGVAAGGTLWGAVSGALGFGGPPAERPLGPGGSVAAAPPPLRPPPGTVTSTLSACMLEWLRLPIWHFHRHG